MGYLDWFKNRSGYRNPFTGQRGGSPSGGGSIPRSLYHNFPRAGSAAAPGQSRGRAFPERFEVELPESNAFHQASRGATDVFAAAGRYPGQVTETPVALLDRLARQATGGSVVEAIGRTPIGGALGVLGEGLERVGNFVPAFINSGAAQWIKMFGDKPDSFELPAMTGAREDGVPILGGIPGLNLLFSRAQTLGELKAELEQRGFLTDPDTGEQRSWGQLVAELRRGDKSIHDFGYAAVNDNPLVDLATRLVTDPTNVLFLVPGANVGKAARVGAQIAEAAGDVVQAARIARPVTNVAADMVRAGLRAPRLPAPVVAKQAVATGDVSRVTLRGIGAFYKDLLQYPVSATLRASRAVGQRAIDPRGYLGLTGGALTATSRLGRAGQATLRGARGYALSSTALSAGLATTGYAAGRIDEMLGGNTFFSGIHNFVLDVENDNPLSESAAWMVASAFSFPYGQIARAGKARISPETLRAFGQDFEPSLARALNFKNVRQLREAMEGPDGVNELLAYLVKHRAAKELESRPMVGQQLGSAPEAAVRAKWSDDAIAPVGLRLLRENKISGDDLVEMFRDWHAEQMGYKQMKGQSLEADARRAPFEPALALRDWKRWAVAQRSVGSTMQVLADGAMTLGLRNHLFREQFDTIRTAVGTGLKDKDVVPQAVIRDLMSEYPALAIGDPTGFWKNAALPDAKPVTWGSMRRKLANQSKNAPLLSETLAPARLAEDAAGRENGPGGVEHVDQRTARLAEELERHRAPDGTILDNDRSRTIQDELAADSARRMEVAQVKRRESDTKAFGPEIAGNLAKMDKAAGLDLPLDQTAWWFDAELREIAQAAERAILEIDPTYTVKALPKDQVLVQMRATDPALYQAIRTRTLLGELLFDRGPIAPLTGFMKALMRPVRADRRARAARQALYQRLIPFGAKPAVVDAWLTQMQNIADKITSDARGQTFRMYRDVSSLPASTINKLAREAFGDNSKVVREFDGRFHDVLDMASSEMWRGVRAAVRKGGRRGQLARAVEAWGEFYREAPGIATVADAGRLVGKTYYHVFRFLMDPRWIALNLFERNFLGGVEDGIARATAQLSEASRYYSSGARRPQKQLTANAQAALVRAEKRLRKGEITDADYAKLTNRLTTDPLVDVLDSGWYYGRGLMGFLHRSFDKRRMNSTVEALNGLAQTDVAALRVIRNRMRREADGELAAARRAVEEGRMTSDQLASIEARAKLDIENSTADLAKLLDHKLYSFDQKGVTRSFTDEAAALLDDQEMQVMQPLLEVLYKRNEELWKDVNRLYHGNPERSTMERIANSYWLYWPISYQIKATKWLARTMLDGSFGHDNGALLAGQYAKWHEQHEERFKNNPAYAAMFKTNQELWFAAQMILPMTPDGLGVSLSRPVRLAGSWLGLFDEYKQVQGPLTATAYITDLGPIYTWHLLQDIEDDVAGRETFPVTVDQRSPVVPPSTFAAARPPSALPAPLAP